MHRAGQAAATTLAKVQALLRPNTTTLEIDEFVAAETRAQGGHCAPLGYGQPPFPRSVCTSKNEVVCHGVPDARVVLQEGDIVNVDVTTRLDGMHGDTSRTFYVGQPSPEAAHLVDVCQRALLAGIEVVRDGVRLRAIGEAIESVVKPEGLSIVTEFGGHGIGRHMHQPPHVHHFAAPGPSPRLRAGMAITIEPIICIGSPEIVFLDDGWTVVTKDRQWSAQFEHTLIVTERGCEITTLPPGDFNLARQTRR